MIRQVTSYSFEAGGPDPLSDQELAPSGETEADALVARLVDPMLERWLEILTSADGLEIAEDSLTFMLAFLLQALVARHRLSQDDLLRWLRQSFIPKVLEECVRQARAREERE